MRPAAFSGAAMVAGVVGRPVTHSLSPALHNGWIAAAGLDAIYAPFQPSDEDFELGVRGLQAMGLRGVNVTVPFKERALALAHQADDAARHAGAANLLLFRAGGLIEARNTDGLGMLSAFRDQAPSIALDRGPVVILGAGGAARGAGAALRRVGRPDLRIVNRSPERGLSLAAEFGGQYYPHEAAHEAFEGAVALINCTSAGLMGSPALDWPLECAPQSCAVMDMTYRPVRTPLLEAAKALGMPTVDGLAMLIGQARPSFEALFGAPAPRSVDARRLMIEAMHD